jgi:TolA-binding protein
MKKSLLAILGLSANLFLIGCADDQARQQIADTNQRLNQLQQNLGVLDNKVSNQKMIDLLNQINDLQSQISQLNGKIANLEQNQSSGQGNVGQQVQALDLRVQALESAVFANNGKLAGSAPVAANLGQNSQLQDAIRKIQANDIASAISELKEIIASNEKPAAQNARYFLSVAYVANNQYKEAISEANKFIATNSNNKYVPDAMRVVFIAQTQLGNHEAATATAKKLIRMFPKSEAAKKVAKQLEH